MKALGSSVLVFSKESVKWLSYSQFGELPRPLSRTGCLRFQSCWMAQEERFTWRDLRDSNETEVLGFPIRTTTWEQILFEVDMKLGSHISLGAFPV
eukprot:symbB.v1.2.034542.t1/scaffold4476.1/size41083/5